MQSSGCPCPAGKLVLLCACRRFPCAYPIWLHPFMPHPRCTCLSQLDQHFGELTVRETLNFAALCQTSRTRKRKHPPTRLPA